MKKRNRGIAVIDMVANVVLATCSSPFDTHFINKYIFSMIVVAYHLRVQKKSILLPFAASEFTQYKKE